MRKTLFLTSKKEDQVARIGVRRGGLGDSGNARKKTSIDVSPNLREKRANSANILVLILWGQC